MVDNNKFEDLGKVSDFNSKFEDLGKVGSTKNSQKSKYPNMPWMDAYQGELPKLSLSQSDIESRIKSLNLPTIGGIGGGIGGSMVAGLPTLGIGAAGGGVVLAGLGGATGKALEQALLATNRFFPDNVQPQQKSLQDLMQSAKKPIKNQIQSSTQRLGQNLLDVGKSGFEQAGGQLLGEGLVRGVGAGFGAIKKIPGIQRLASEAGQGFGTSSFPEPVKDIQEALLKGKETLGQEAAKRGIYGFKRSVLNLLNVEKKNIGAQIDFALDAASKEKIDPALIAKEAQQVQQKFIKLGRHDLADKIAGKIAEWSSNFIGGVDEAGKQIQQFWSPAQANIVKRHFADVAENAYKTNNVAEIATVEAEYAKAIADSIRTSIEKAVPGIKYLNSEYNIYSKLGDSVAKTMAQDLLRTGPKLSEAVVGGEAAAIGEALGAPIKTTGLALGLRTFPVKTLLAAKLYQFAKEPTKQALYGVMKDPSISNAIFRAIVNFGVNKKFSKEDKK